MKVTAKTVTKIALLKELKELYKQDKIHNQIGKLVAKMEPQKKEIKKLEKDLVAQGIEIADHTFESKGVTLASVTQNKPGFKVVGFFKDLGKNIHAELGEKTAMKAMDCVKKAQLKNTTESKTWKLVINED